jgi:3-hydroxyisobutyrate dehydrogenase-like beta-hydroxyacid dehydrogenase
MEVVAFLGLGAMGRGMAANLQRSLRSSDSPQIAEQDLLVYNRSPGPAAAMAADAEMRCVPVQECGALRTRSTPATVLCLMLANDAACDAVLAQLCAVGLSGALIINHSTVTPECAEAAAARVADAGGEYISAIVWGRPDAAAAARLLVAPGGPQHAIDRAAPFLRAHGTLLPAQSSPGAACAFKLTGGAHLNTRCLLPCIQVFSHALLQPFVSKLPTV